MAAIAAPLVLASRAVLGSMDSQGLANILWGLACVGHKDTVCNVVRTSHALHLLKLNAILYMKASACLMVFSSGRMNNWNWNRFRFIMGILDLNGCKSPVMLY
jgi:hypothetical protein